MLSTGHSRHPPGDPWPQPTCNLLGGRGLDVGIDLAERCHTLGPHILEDLLCERVPPATKCTEDADRGGCAPLRTMKTSCTARAPHSSCSRHTVTHLLGCTPWRSLFVVLGGASGRRHAWHDSRRHLLGCGCRTGRPSRQPAGRQPGQRRSRRGGRRRCGGARCCSWSGVCCCAAAEDRASGREQHMLPPVVRHGAQLRAAV